MSVLDEKIIINKEVFDVHEPNAGHFDRFREKIGFEEHKPSLTKRSLGIVWKVAAVAVLMIGLSVIYHDSPNNSGNVFAAGVMDSENYSEELQELRIYYNQQKEEKIDEINNLSCMDSDCAELKEFAAQEVDQLETSAVELEGEWVESENDRRIFTALVSNYRLMAKVLDDVLEQMKSKK
jgi:hypothetical protein